MGRWKRKWAVREKFTRKLYIVSLTQKDEWQCSCPAWIYKRRECIHITIVKTKLGLITTPFPMGKFKAQHRGSISIETQYYEVEEIDPEITGTLLKIANSLGREDEA